MKTQSLKTGKNLPVFNSDFNNDLRKQKYFPNARSGLEISSQASNLKSDLSGMQETNLT